MHSRRGPTKSRIAGSAVHARRSAARVSSAGTPGCRKARMSVPPRSNSIDGRLREIERRFGLSRRARRCAAAAARQASRPCRRGSSRRSGRQLVGLAPHACGATSASGNRPARSSSSSSRSRTAPRQRFRIGAIALALEERLLDMMLGDERRQRPSRIALRHRHRLDQIVAGFGAAPRLRPDRPSPRASS